MTDQTPDNSSSSENPPVIEGYRILSKLGRGATSSVWKAEQISLNRLVVIKVLSERLTHESENVTLFKAEARTAANFKHAGIVQVYDFGQSKTDRRYYFVMEYISGYSVGDWVRRKGKITEHEALVVVQAVADALKYAWDLSQIVHCDIKPDNIIVDGDGTIKVADLGLAHAVKTLSNQPHAGAQEVVVMGTPNYMAPEQVRGTDLVDCRTDIYALGASLYHMVTGQLPFGDSPPDVVLERQLQEPFEYPQKINPDLSVSVTRLIMKMTAKDPSARFQTWDEVMTEVVRLERQMRQQEAPATKPAAVAASAALAEQSPAYDSKKSGALAEDGRTCKYCGKPVQPRALYCGFCGKPVAAPAQEPVKDRQRKAVHEKPLRSKSPANGKPVAALPGNAGQDMAPPPVPKSPTMRKHLSWKNGISMVVSLCLLSFIGYHAYQKSKNDHDVIIPIRSAVIKWAQQVHAQGRLYIERGRQKGAKWKRSLTEERDSTKPAPSGDQSKVAPKDKPMPTEAKPTPPKEKPIPADSEMPEELAEEESEAMQESESPSLPAKALAPESNEAAESATSKAQAQSETPPAVSESPQPAPEAAPAKPSQDEEYERILQTCKQQQPKFGDRITICFKNDREPVEGVLEQMTSTGVKVKVPAGVIEYPFLIMAEASRVVFFPEEHARRLQRQKSP